MTNYTKVRISKKNETATLWDVYSQQTVTVGFYRLSTKDGAHRYIAPMTDAARKRVLKAMSDAGY